MNDQKLITRRRLLGLGAGGAVIYALARSPAIIAAPQDDTAELLAAVERLNAKGGRLSLPARTYYLSRGLVLTRPGVEIVGSGRGQTILRAKAAIDMIRGTSMSLVSSLSLDGNGIGKRGFYTEGADHRAELANARLENFVDAAFDVDSPQNAAYSNIFALNNRVGFRLRNPMNCSFNSINASIDGGDHHNNRADARNLLMLGGRNINVQGGIFERGGAAAASVEIRGGSVSFFGTEFNAPPASGAAALLISDGDVTLEKPAFTFNTADAVAVRSTGGQYEILGQPTYSGLSGRAGNLLFSGDGRWNGSLGTPLLQSVFRTDAAGWVAAPGGSATVEGNTLRCSGTVRKAIAASLKNTPSIKGRRLHLTISCDLPLTVNLAITSAPGWRPIGKVAAGSNNIDYVIRGDEVLAIGLAGSANWHLESVEVSLI